MADCNERVEEAVCIDEEIFFGPITDKEKKIRQYFENPNKNHKSSIESVQVVENDISRNDSLYKSFSVEESKYDSFEDSLNEEIDEKPQRAKHITLRKSFDKLKAKKHAFYDSLEDVCSLVSNIDKCSISCDVESISNFAEKQPIIEDSLQIPHILVTNKSQGFSEQIHFDEDSLAIAELENTFDDSLEEINMISSIEIEEVNNDLDDIEEESLFFSNIVNQMSDTVARNLFETSVQIICEKKNLKAELEEPFDYKNKLFDSLTNSDYKDSLEESEKSIGKLNLKHIPVEQISVEEQLNNAEIREINELDASVQIIYEKLVNSSDGEYVSCSECYDLSKDSLEKSKNVETKLKKELDVSAQIMFEKMGSSSDAEHISCSECCDLSKDSLEKSKNADILSSVETEAENMDLKEPTLSKFATPISLFKDSVEKSKNADILSPFETVAENMDLKEPTLSKFAMPSYATEESEHLEKDVLDSSVQILYEKKHSACEKTISVFDCSSVSKDNLESIKSNSCSLVQAVLSSSHSSDSKEHCPMAFDVAQSDQSVIKIATPHISGTKVAVPNISGASQKKVLVCNSIVNNASKALKDNAVTTDCISSSIIDNSDSKTEVITIDASQLRFLNDNLNLDKDLKLELQIEVTVGDKKCKIASENIKIIPVINPESHESVASPTDCKKTNIVDENKLEEHLVFINSELSGKENKKDVQIYEMNSIENILTEANITQRSKDSLEVSEMNLKDTSLLQALDLHDISLFNESIIQSKDSIMPLNLCSRDQAVHMLYSSVPRDESKENFPEVCLFQKQYCSKQDSCSSQSKACPKSINDENKTPKSLKNTSNSRENSAKKTPGTKIPVMQKVHKVNNFALPVPSAHKVKQNPVSADNDKKCLHSPHSTDSAKKTPSSSSKKHHFCKVRNTIFSKVPQIVPSKKFVNVQSPVAKYIRNEGGTPVKNLILDPVLRDCMNDIHFRQQLESPYQPHALPKAGASKLMKRK